MSYTQTYTVAIDRTKCASGNLTNFPVMISASHSSLKSTAHGGDVTDGTNGYDIVVFVDDGTLSNYVPWEVDFWDPVNGTLVIHALCSLVNGSSSGANSTLVVTWGNSGITTQQNVSSFAPANVWDSFFKAVLHFANGTTLNLNDSTSNANNGSDLFPGNIAAAAGKVDGAVFVNSSGSVQVGGTVGSSGFPTGASVCTMSCWITANLSGATKIAFALGDGGNTDKGYLIVAVAGGIRAGLTNHLITTPAFASLFHLVVISYDGTQQHVYVDGSEVTGSPTTQTANIDASFSCLAGLFWDGRVDEVRVSNGIARSADWIFTEWSNQNSPGNIGAADFLIWTPGAVVSTNQPQMFVMT